MLESLPTELILGIVSQLDTVTDVVDLLRASHHVNAICQLRLEHVLPPIIQRDIAPEAMQYALASITVVQQCPLPAQGNNTLGAYRETYRVSVEHFLAEFWANGIRESAFDTRPDRILALAKLLARVNRFVDDYFVRTQSLIRGIADTYNTDVPPSISRLSLPDNAVTQGRLKMTKSERARLQRAFFCFDFYSRCFPLRAGALHSDSQMLNTQFQCRHFMRYITPWQVEELACIYEYLRFRLEKRIGWCEQRLFEEIIADADDQASSRLPTDNAIDIGYSFFSDFDDRLFLYSLKGKQSFHDEIACLLSCGLAFLETLVLGAPEEARDLIRCRCARFREGFLRQAIQQATRSHFPNTIRNQTLLVERGNMSDQALGRKEDPSAPNYGYRTLSVWPGDMIVRDFRHAALRQSGYVFWDSDLLRVPAFDNYIKRAQARYPGSLLSGESGDWGEVSDVLPDVSGGPSVEEMLPRMPIRKEKMEEILEKYGREFRQYDHGKWREDEPVSSFP